MRLKSIGLFFLASAAAIFADTIPITFNVDVQTPTVFDIVTYAGNTPVIKVGILTNGGAFTNLGSGWSPQLNYAKNDYASYIKTITGTIDSATGVATFNAVTNTFPASGDYFAEVFITNTAARITCGQGIIRVKRSPSGGAIGSLNLMNRINWDIIENTGTLPWSDFDTNYLYSIIVANANAQNTTNLAFAAAIASNDTFRLTTQPNTNAALLLQITNNLATQQATNLLYTALHTNQANTNTGFESRLASLESADTNQANTNSGFQSLLDGLRVDVGANTTNNTLTSNAFNLSVGAVQTNLNTASQALDTARANLQTNLNTASNALRVSIGLVQTNFNNGSNNLYILIRDNVTNINLTTNALNLADGALQTNLNLASNYFGTVDTAQGNNLTTASNSLQSQITALGGGGFYRYFARTNASETVEVLASSTNVVVTRTNSTFYYTIPVSSRLLSSKMRVDGSLTASGVIYLQMGTNDLPNTGITTDWNPVYSCFREDTLANVAIVCAPDSSDNTLIRVSGLGTSAGVVYSLRFGW